MSPQTVENHIIKVTGLMEEVWLDIFTVVTEIV
jgi:hypothetical protein